MGNPRGSLDETPAKEFSPQIYLAHTTWTEQPHHLHISSCGMHLRAELNQTVCEISWALRNAKRSLTPQAHPIRAARLGLWLCLHGFSGFDQTPENPDTGISRELSNFPGQAHTKLGGPVPRKSPVARNFSFGKLGPNARCALPTSNMRVCACICACVQVPAMRTGPQ